MTDCNLAGSLTPASAKAVLPLGKRLLGIDLGSKTVGLAVSDGLLMAASPRTTLRRRTFAQTCTALRACIAEEDVGGIVVGLPLEMDGKEGKRCQSTRQFVANLREAGPPFDRLPVAFWDERLSTAAVRRMMIEEMDLSRSKQAQAVDRLAAAYILQGFLDAIRLTPSNA